MLYKKEVAISINLVDINLRRTVRLVHRNNITIPSSINKTQEESLEEIKNVIKEKKEGFLELGSDKDDRTDFQVAINDQGEYEILDSVGNSIPNLAPLKIDRENNSALKIIHRLEHLAVYINILQLDNRNSRRSLSDKLVVELSGVSTAYQPGEKLNVIPIKSVGNIKIVNVGQKLVLQIRNAFPEKSKQVMNITVFDLQPDWGISQIYPTSANFIPVDPGHEEYFTLQADLPPSYKEGKDVLKVFATTDQLSFRWLELPPLYDSLDVTSQRRLKTGLHTTASKDWTTSQIDIQITAKGLRIFISFAREDSEAAQRLSYDLRNAGLNPWTDREYILPGQNWKTGIKNALKNSQYFIAILSSNSVEKRGYVQRELKEALDVLKENPTSNISIIPVRLDNCDIPYNELREIQHVDLFPNWNEGIRKVLQVTKGK